MINVDETIELYLELKNVCNLSVDMQVLFCIEQCDVCSPKYLINKLNIVKSNLCTICKNLILNDFICITKSNLDKKAIYYQITQNGKMHLNKIKTDIINNIKLSPKIDNITTQTLGEINKEI